MNTLVHFRESAATVFESLSLSLQAHIGDIVWAASSAHGDSQGLVGCLISDGESTVALRCRITVDAFVIERITMK